MKRGSLVKEAAIMMKTDKDGEQRAVAIGPEIFVDDKIRGAMLGEIQRRKAPSYTAAGLAGGITGGLTGMALASPGKRLGPSALGAILGAGALSLATNKGLKMQENNAKKARSISFIGEGELPHDARRELRYNSESAARSLARDKNPVLTGYDITRYNV